MSTTPSAEQRQPTSQAPVNAGRAQLVALLAVALGVCFFVPWIHFLFGQPSGFDLAKREGANFAFWLWPALCSMAVFTALTGRPHRLFGQLAGAAPFAVFAWAYADAGNLRFVDHITGGGWAALVLGTLLFVGSRR